MARRDSGWYRYEPLEPNQIRLVHLHAGTPMSPLQCSLTSHTLNDHLVFEALSYTWGDPRNVSDIHCDNKAIQVTRNLTDAMIHLRRETEERTFWIDAICINQGDVNERSVQVQLMGQIYKQATSVLVWLGNPTEDSSSAFNLMDQLHRLAKETAVEDLDRPIPKESDLLETLPKVNDPAWKALDSLLWRPWFSRAWIIQEIAMSRSARVFCGDDNISWHDFLVVIDFLNRRFLTFLVNLDLGVAYPIRAIYYYCRGESYRPLTTLLSMARRSLAGNPCDKVYALLGLASDSPIIPDYRLQVTEVYQAVSRTLLLQSLDVLSLVGPPRWKAIDGLPSWVVDCSLALLERPYLFSSGRPFNACGSTTQSPRFSADGKSLFVQGVLFDRVALHGTTNINPNVTSDAGYAGVSTRGLGEMWDGAFSITTVRRFRYWERLVLRLKYYPTGEPIESVLHRTMIADYLGNMTDSLATASLAEHYGAFRRHTVKFPGEKVQIGSITGELGENYNKIYSAATTSATVGRRLFTTKKGYAGLGPSATRVADCVVFLAGGRTAYIVREEKVPGTYTFLGEAYVHGIMDGEAFQGRYTLQEFQIV